MRTLKIDVTDLGGKAQPGDSVVPNNPGTDTVPDETQSEAES